MDSANVTRIVGAEMTVSDKIRAFRVLAEERVRGVVIHPCKFTC